jgi:uncharacterized membrane protein
MLAFAVLMFLGLVIGSIAVIVRLTSLSSKTGDLERQIHSLLNRTAELEKKVRQTPPGLPVSERGVPPSTSAPVQIPVQTVAPPPAAAVPPVPPRQATPPPVPAPLITGLGERPPSRSREEWEALIGGKLLNRIGAVALILGMGFFLKYAFDNNWITETLRVIIGGVLGGICLVLANSTSRKGFQIFSQGLVGAGIAILYLSVFASFNYYALVSQPVAFLLMAAVTVIAFEEAFRYDALAVSLLGLIGGFLTPFLLSTGEANMVGLLSYTAILDIGLMVVILRKDAWMVLEPLAMLGTYSIYLSWYAAFFREADLIAALLFLTLFWLIFHGMDVVRIRRVTISFFEIRRAMSIVHSVVYYLCLYQLLQNQSHDLVAGVTLSLGALYAGSAFLAEGGERERNFIFGQLIVTGMVLLFTATIIEYRSFTRVMVCSLEALVLGWSGLRARQKTVWRTAFFCFPILGMALLGLRGSLAYLPIEEFRLLLTQRALAFGVVGASVGIAGMLYGKLALSPAQKVKDLFHYGWLAALFVGLTVETNDLFRLWMIGQADAVRDHLTFQRYMTIAGVWTLAAWPLLWVGLRTKLRPLFFSSLWIILAAVCIACLSGFRYSPIELYQIALNGRVLVLLLLCAASIHVASLLARSSQEFDWVPEFRSIYRYVPVILLLALVSAETWDFFRQQIAMLDASVPTAPHEEELMRLANLQQISLSAVWLLFSIVLMVLGLWRRDRALRLQSIALFGIAILKIFIYDLSFLETLYRIFSFLGLGVILLAVSYLYQRYRDIILDVTPGKRP